MKLTLINFLQSMRKSTKTAKLSIKTINSYQYINH